MNPKKVLILNYGLHIAGVSRTLANFANALVNHGYDVTIKIAVNDFTLASELDPRVKRSLFLKEPHPFGLRIKGFLRFYDLWLKRLLKLPAERQYRAVVKENYDIEIAFNRGAAARIIAGSTNKDAIKLAWVHNDYVKNSNPIAGFDSVSSAAEAYAKFDHVVCVSEQSEVSFIKKFGDTHNTITKYNIMDVERMQSLSQEGQCKKEKGFTLVACGRLHEQKNYPLLLDAVALLNSRGINVNCMIVGDGEEKDNLIRLHQQLHLDNVTFCGAQTNPYPYFAAADLYVSSSIYEGLSTTTIEALILGKPCVVTDCTGMRNILGEHNEYGVVVPIDAAALADAIEKFTNDTAYREHYTKQAQERAKDFDPEKAFRSIEELFCKR